MENANENKPPQVVGVIQMIVALAAIGIAISVFI